MTTPNPTPPPARGTDASAARRRRARRQMMPASAEGRAALMIALARRAYPTYEYFIFAVLCGAVLGLGFLLDSPPVLLFGILIVPLGVVSIFFIIIQPIWIGTWCTLCLVGALAMLLQIPYSFDEILATLQFLKHRRQQGKPRWYVLLRGDTMAGGSADYSDNFEAPARAVLREILLSGVNLPWTLLASGAIGIALMGSRLLFDASGAAADSAHIVGSLVVSVSIMAWGEVARPLRFVNIGFGAWLAAAPWLIDGYTGTGAAMSVLSGLALAWLSFPPGRIEGHYGAWDRIAHLSFSVPRRLRHAQP